ncbi:MAG: hypothetical protein ABI232_06145 [Jatrophihabitantaceae bacterium]
MRIVLALGVALFVGGIVAACVFWAGVNSAGSVAFALAGLAIAFVVPVVIGRFGNWDVPGDEPAFGWLAKH